MKNENNPSLFRKLSEPHESVDALDASMVAFYEDVKAAREKHGLLNAVVVISSPALREGEEEMFQGSVSFGDSLKVPMMLAQALGDAERDFEKTIEALKSGKGRKR